MSDFKKYPENKQSEDANEFEEVYAGPEEMEERTKAPMFSKVYAGPSATKGDRKAFEGVYAGPAGFGIGIPQEDTICECVYAGPVKEEEPPVSVEFADESSETQNEPSIEPKPEFDPNIYLNSQQFMCVYAGPEQMSGTYQPIGAYAPQPVDEGAKYCSNCGMKLKETDRFCAECGTKVNGND